MFGVTTTEGYVTFLDYANFALVSIAALVHMRAAQVGLLTQRPLHIVICILAIFYSVAYAVLLWTPVTVEEWSNVVRGVGPIAYTVVWIFPALKDAKIARKADQLRAQLDHQRDEQLDD